MRAILVTAAGCVLVSVAMGVQAKASTRNDRLACTWGSEIAAEAQQSKLSGVTLYTARKRLQARRFPKPWMRMTALGITEQTYDSRSRLKPAAIRQTYQEQCMQHAASRR